MRVKGKNIGIFINNGTENKPIGLSTSCSLHISSDTIDMASIASMAKSFKSGRYTYTLDVDRLYDGTGDDADFSMMYYLLLSQLEGTGLDFIFSEAVILNGEQTIDGNSSITFSGKVLVTNYDIQAPVDGYATARISFQGTGALNIEY